MASHEDNLRTVGEVSHLLGLSVRTLHHWEERGLVVPTSRSWSNYRLYSEEDIARLQQVMIYRATGMPLEDITDLLESADDPLTHLRRQRDLLMKKEADLHQMVAAIDQLLEDAMSKKNLTVEEVAEILGDADFPKHQTEAEQTYGDTDDWHISQQNTAKMSKADWEAQLDKTNKLEQTFVDAMNAGVQPDSPEAKQLAEQHRQLQSNYFPITYSKHVLLARNYVNDPRFTAYFEKRGKGLAHWLKEAIEANAQDHGIDLDNVDWV